MTYEEWLVELDRALVTRAGYGHSDRPEILWGDYFDDGMSPTEAIEQAIEEGWIG